MIGFGIWTMVALVFVCVGIHTWKSRCAAGFFNGVKPPEVKDVKAYNHAVAKLWWCFALILEVIGLPLLVIEQNDPAALIMVLLVPAAIIVMVVCYLRIEKKYKKLPV